MISKQKHTNQSNLFNGLADQLNQKHPLFLLSKRLDWNLFEIAFTPLYSLKMGAPAKPIRLMVSLLILKYVRNLSDENVVEHWSENAYYQYFSGEHFFRPTLPCVPTELVAFRHRIGVAGMELILQESIRINNPNDDENVGKIVSVDTTIQEKNITYPTDDKLHKRIIEKCVSTAKEEQITLRQTYAKEIKKLSILQRFRKRKNGFKIAAKASRRIKVIAGRVLRNLEQNLVVLGVSRPKEELKLFKKVLAQKRSDSHKIYSLHEPDVKCYSKGKEYKKYEFGSKVSVVVCQYSGIVLGALNFTDTLHDSKTIPAVLKQLARLQNKLPQKMYADRGYVGKSVYGNTKICTPKPNPAITIVERKRHSKRAAIEPIIGHLKSDYRLCRNFLKGIIGDAVNCILSAAAMNFKRVMNLWKKEAQLSWQFICSLLTNCLRLFYARNLMVTF